LTSAVPVVECVADGMPAVQDSSGNVVLPEDIRPYPVGDRVHSTAVRRKAKSATLITGSPFKAQLMDKGVSKRKSKSNSKLQPKPKGQKMNPKPKVKPSTKSRKVKNDGGNRNSVENDECGSCEYKYGEQSCYFDNKTRDLFLQYLNKITTDAKNTDTAKAPELQMTHLLTMIGLFALIVQNGVIFHVVTPQKLLLPVISVSDPVRQLDPADNVCWLFGLLF